MRATCPPSPPSMMSHSCTIPVSVTVFETLYGVWNQFLLFCLEYVCAADSISGSAPHHKRSPIEYSRLFTPVSPIKYDYNKFAFSSSSLFSWGAPSDVSFVSLRNDASSRPGITSSFGVVPCFPATAAVWRPATVMSSPKTRRLNALS